MQHRLNSVGVRVLVLVIASVVLVPRVRADEAADLDRAIRLFDQREFLTAQQILVGIDRSRLSASRQTERDDLLNRVQVAVRMYEKAVRDLEDAETAVQAGENDEARLLLDSVRANPYAADPVRASAAQMLRTMGFPADEPPVETDRGAAAAGAEMPHESEPHPKEPTHHHVAPPETGSMEPARPDADDVQRARVLTGEGDEMVRGGRTDEAIRLYEQALDLVPGLPEAVAGIQQAKAHARNVSGTRALSLIEQIRREDAINWQRVVVEYREVEQAVRDNVSAEHFEEARRLLVRAGQIVGAGRQFADPVSHYEQLHADYKRLASWLDGQERTYNEQKVAEIRRDIEKDRTARLRADEQNRRRQVDSLMAQSMQHRKDGDLDAAITLLRQITVIAPKDRTARWMLDELQDRRQYVRARELRGDLYRESRMALLDVEESKIPWHQELLYPQDWPELIARPERSRPSPTGRDRRLFGALDRQIPVRFRGDPFHQVIEELADAQRVNIIVNWHDLLRAGVQRDAPINLHLPNEIALKKALTEVLEQAGGGLVDIGYDVSEGAIKIATRQTLDKQTFTAVYDIQDLLMEIPNFNDVPMTDLGHVTRELSRRMISQRADLPWRYGDDDDDETEEDPQRSSRVMKIIELIEETVAPHSWFDRGGSIGTIKEINGQLVITQNSAAHGRIGDLLGKLREQRAIQIAVEARFVSVSSHYLEDLGVDIDVVLNNGNAGFDYVAGGSGALTDPILGTSLLLPRQFSRLGFTPTSPGFGNVTTALFDPLEQPFGNTALVPSAGGGGGSQLSPVPVLSGVSQITNPVNLGSDVPGSFAGQAIGPAFSLFGSFLDNIQVDFLIRATQADSRTTVLTAPRLVLFNGQRSWVAVTIQQGYIGTLQPVVNAGAVAQQPQPGTINSGAVLDVTATVTSDRRYINLSLRPGVTRLLDLQTIPFSGGAAGGGIGGGGTALPAFVQLPTLSSQRVQTTVSVPDGGTLLIGGQKLASETEIEAGVPVLSKIPLLKRAYSSRSTVKDEQTLLILVKPRILIQTEQEELAFPSFRAG